MSPVFSRVRDRLSDKALLVGFEYHNSPDPAVKPLNGVHDEIRQFQNHLLEYQGYRKQNIKVILDDDRKACRGPTVMDVEREISWLVKDAKAGDRLIFMFSGHGYQLNAREGSSELDKKDEAILIDPYYGEPVTIDGSTIDPWRLPADHEDRKKLQGIIVDNRLRQLLVDRLNGGVHLYTIWNTCHSGSLVDLPYNWCIRGSRFSRLSQSNYVVSTSVRRYSTQAPRRNIAEYVGHPDDLPQILEDAPRCSSPMTIPYTDDEQPYVTSISSSEDYQCTFGEGNVSMVACLIRILEKYKEAFTVQGLGILLVKKMRSRRQKAFDQAWYKSYESHANERQEKELRDVQLPQFGSLAAEGSDALFEL